MPAQASNSSGGAADGARRRPAAGAAPAGAAPSTPAAAQPLPEPQHETFAVEKLRWALAVPRDQRQPSMQGFIDCCECTTEATQLLAAAPLAQLAGPAKLRALLLLLKAYFCFGGQSPLVCGAGRLPARGSDSRLCVGAGAAEYERREDPLLIHPELQPLYCVAATAAYLTHTAAMRTAHCSGLAIANSSSPAVAHSISGRRVAGASAGVGTVRQQVAALRLDEVAGAVDSLLKNFRQDGYCGLLQQQLDSIGGGLLTARQLEHDA